MNEWAINIFEWLQESGIGIPLAVALLSTLPIAEARIALPLGIKCGLSAPLATLCSFLGSSFAAALLCAFFLPVINRLSKSKIFGGISRKLFRTLKLKSVKINANKAVLSLCAFVAVPLPLTGIWTGSAIAAILNLSYLKSLIAVIGGNFLACIIIAVISSLLDEYISVILWAFAALAIASVIVALIKNFKKAA